MALHKDFPKDFQILRMFNSGIFKVIEKNIYGKNN